MAALSVLVIDNYDSFTFTLVDYLKSAGAAIEVARNDSLSVEEAVERSDRGILISPGPGKPADAGISVALAAACIERQRPLLGVCLGHQAIALACGCSVSRVPPVHGKAEEIEHDGSGVFIGLPSPLAATRYHSLASRESGPPLLTNAWSSDGLIMGIRHAAAPVHGVQFHPESIGSSHGRAIIRNFLRIAEDELSSS